MNTRRPACSRLFIQLLCAAFLGLLTVEASAQRVKLSGPMALDSPADVGTNQYSPDGNWIVYLATQIGLGGDVHLFAAPADGSGPRIDLGGPVYSESGDFWVTPDSSAVLFTSGGYKVVPIDGSAQPSSLSIDGIIQAISPDSSMVFYEDDDQLWAALLDGSSPPFAVSPPGLFLRGTLIFTADPSIVIYRGPKDGRIHLFKSDLTAPGTAVDLTAQFGPSDQVGAGELAADGTQLVFRAWDSATTTNRLFRVPTDGSASASPISSIGDVEPDYRLSPDGMRVVFGTLSCCGSWVRLYSVPVDGSAPEIEITGVQHTALGIYGDYFVTPDSTRVVYRAGSTGLFVVPIDVAHPTAIALPGGGFVAGISPDSEFILSHAHQGSQLFATRMDGGSAPVIVSETFGGQVVGGDSRFVFTAVVDQVRWVMSSPWDGSRAPAVLGAAVHEAPVSVYDLWISPNDDRVLYRADHETDNFHELFTRPIDGSGALRKVNGPLPSTVEGDVSRFQIDPTNSRVVYFADQRRDGVEELFSAPVDGSEEPVLLMRDPQDGFLLDFRELQFTSDGETAVVRAKKSQGGFQLYALPVDGDGEEVRLTGSTALIGSLDDKWWIVGDRVVFTTVRIVSSTVTHTIYGVPLDGSAQPMILSAPGEDDRIDQFRIDAGGTRILYIKSDELWSAPIDGSSVATTLNPPLAGDDRVLWFETDGASSTAAYTARRGSLPIQLYSVPIDGSAPAVRLTDGLDSLDYHTPLLHHPGGRIVFTSEREGAMGLFSILPDGTGRTTIADPLPGGGEFEEVVLGTGRRLVYSASQGATGAEVLYGASIDGSYEPFLLTDPASEGVQYFRLDPTGQRVIWRTDVPGSPRGIFERAIDGSGVVQDVSGPREASHAYIPFIASEFETLFLARVGPGYCTTGYGQQCGLFSRSALSGETVRLDGGGQDGRMRTFGDAGHRAVFIGDRDEAGVFELYMVRKPFTDGPGLDSDSNDERPGADGKGGPVDHP